MRVDKENDVCQDHSKWKAVVSTFSNENGCVDV